MLAAAGILGLGSVVFAYYMGGEAEKDGVDITEIDKDTREMAADLKELAEKKWILLDPEFGKRLKKALNKNPEEQFTDQDIDDIYKKLTDLKVIQ
jgi:hypothetical protein